MLNYHAMRAKNMHKMRFSKIIIFFLVCLITNSCGKKEQDLRPGLPSEFGFNLLPDESAETPGNLQDRACASGHASGAGYASLAGYASASAAEELNIDFEVTITTISGDVAKESLSIPRSYFKTLTFGDLLKKLEITILGKKISQAQYLSIPCDYDSDENPLCGIPIAEGAPNTDEVKPLYKKGYSLWYSSDALETESGFKFVLDGTDKLLTPENLINNLGDSLEMNIVMQQLDFENEECVAWMYDIFYKIKQAGQREEEEQNFLTKYHTSLKKYHTGSNQHPKACRACHFPGGLCWKGRSCSFCHICPKPRRKSKHQQNAERIKEKRRHEQDVERRTEEQENITRRNEGDENVAQTAATSSTAAAPDNDEASDIAAADMQQEEIQAYFNSLLRNK
jgi:hypothetical protein